MQYLNPLLSLSFYISHSYISRTFEKFTSHNAFEFTSLSFRSDKLLLTALRSSSSHLRDLLLKNRHFLKQTFLFDHDMTDVFNIFNKKRCPFKMNTYHETRQQTEYTGTVFLAKFTHKQQQPLTWSESQGYTISWAHRPTTSSVFASGFLNEILMHSEKVKYCYNQ